MTILLPHTITLYIDKEIILKKAMKTKINKLIPYLNFEGNCEEALNYYKDILGGTVEILG